VISPRRDLSRAVTALALVAAALAGGCSDSGTQSAASPAAGGPHRGPFFPQCGGVSDQTIARLTRLSGLANTAQNSVGCQWLLHGSIRGPYFSFSWYRSSPIGRERRTVQVNHPSVEDITISGHNGFIATGSEANLGDNLCEIGLQFDDDFIEWTVYFNQKPFPDPCDIAKELTRQSVANSR
jgi:hypothetical protein